MSVITTILFDFDGTLADTNTLISESHLHVLEQYFPGKYTTESVRKFNGPSLEQTYSELNPKNWEEMVAQYREYNHAVHDELIKAFPGVAEALVTLKAKGLKLAVVSTKYETVLKRGLEVLGLTDYFDLISAGDHCQEVKPNPEQLNKAMAALNVKPTECLMVGDNWQDIQAGHNAGVEAVFVEWSEKTLAEIAPYKPNKTVATMLELTQYINSRIDGSKS